MAALTGEVLRDVSTSDKQNLNDIYELLERLFTRNRNQHRRNHWFKSLHQFRKQLGLLLGEMESTKKVTAARLMTERLQFWDEKCIHQWYL
jgi:ribonuclease MRP protein subunit RMP1